MTIDFHSPANAGSYSSRDASGEWRDLLQQLAAPQGKRVVDVGCGGGIYARAFSGLGAASVTGVDSSATMVADAAKACASDARIAIQQGRADATGLPAGSADIVFARALVHHLPALKAAFQEAFRLLAPGGVFVVQDRTMADVRAPASPDHLRGYFFEAFPRLMAIEAERRPDALAISDALAVAGFGAPTERVLWETRAVFSSQVALAGDLRARTGRSLLHALSDAELEAMIAHVLAYLPKSEPITDRDRWTIWCAAKPE